MPEHCQNIIVIITLPYVFNAFHRSRTVLELARFSCGVLTEGGHVECWGNGALPTESPSLEALEGKIPDEVNTIQLLLLCVSKQLFQRDIYILAGLQLKATRRGYEQES